MPRPYSVSFTMVAKDVDAIAASQTATAAGDLALSGALATAGGGTATLDAPRHIGIYATGDNSGVTFTASGTDRYGTVRTETITGATGGSATSTTNFKTVTGISTSTASVGPVTVGTASSADTPWWPQNWRSNGVSVTMQGRSVSGAFNWGVEHTVDDIQAAGANPESFYALADATLTASGSSRRAELEQPVRASRFAITAATGAVSFTGTFLQQGT